jgi:hypothetical protein
MIELPIKPIYSLAELAHTCGVDRRILQTVLAREGIEFIGDGKLTYVSVAELERKLPTLLEGIRVAHSLLEDLR